LFPLVMQQPLASTQHSAIVGIALILCILAWVTITWSALACVARSMIAGQPIPLRDLPKRAWRSSLKAFPYVIAVGGAKLLIAANVVFYAHLARTYSGGVGLLCFSLSIFFIYVFFCYVAYAMALIGSWVANMKSSLLSNAKSALIALIVIPRLWISAFVFGSLSTLLLLISILGSIYVLSLWVVLSATAFQLAQEYIANLKVATTELGEGHSVRQYRRKAVILCLENEYKKPRRTLRELLKPWEY